MIKWKVCVIGGGAAGIVSALRAKQSHDSVLLLERNNRIGKKLLATGNGRCNYTNVQATAQDYNHPEFVDSIFRQFGVTETINYFEALGIPPKIEDAGKTYPMSEQASSFLDVFLYEIERTHLSVWTDSFVTKIEKINHGFRLTLSDQRQIETETVILTTGGKAMPKSGSDGSGYLLAKSLGHTIIEPLPSLTKMLINDRSLKELDGTKVQAKVSLSVDGTILQEEEGDFLWTDYGVSGPTILQLSCLATRLFQDQKTIELHVNFLPQMDPLQIYERFARMNDKSVYQSLIGLIHKRMIPALLKQTHVPSSSTAIGSLSKEMTSQLIKRLFDWPLTITGFRGYDDAQATIGGVSIDDINPKSLASRLVKGFYFAGELIDIDGRCGGYNLQWAWSSGMVAGENAAKEASDDSNL